MKNQFVTFEIAKKLKELGFNEPCLACYDACDLLSTYSKSIFKPLNYNNDNSSPHTISAPLWQQVIEWFVEKQNIEIQVSNYENKNDKYDYSLNNVIYSEENNLSYDSSYEKLFYNTRYEAREAGILAAFKYIK